MANVSSKINTEKMYRLTMGDNVCQRQEMTFDLRRKDLSGNTR